MGIAETVVMIIGVVLMWPLLYKVTYSAFTFIFSMVIPLEKDILIFRDAAGNVKSTDKFTVKIRMKGEVVISTPEELTREVPQKVIVGKARVKKSHMRGAARKSLALALSKTSVLAVRTKPDKAHAVKNISSDKPMERVEVYQPHACHGDEND